MFHLFSHRGTKEVPLLKIYNNHDIIILKVDKGNATVIMNTSDYDAKILDLLSSSSYKPLAKNPLNTITNLVTKAIKASSLDPSIQKCLIPLNPTTPRIYGQPKIHKKDIPLRPIVSAIGAPTHALARFLADKLKTFTGKTSSFIKDSYDFIQKTQDLHLDDQDLLISFDVVSLFTKILIPEALDLISKLVDPKPSILLKFSLTSTFFTFKGTCYEQMERYNYGVFLIPRGR
jgi:hypothetical protein